MRCSGSSGSVPSCSLGMRFAAKPSLIQRAIRSLATTGDCGAEHGRLSGAWGDSMNRCDQRKRATHKEGAESYGEHYWG